jgi:hypothetical protein
MISLPTSTHNLTIAPSGTPRPFLVPLEPPGDFLLVIDNSTLERWKRCPLAFRNYKVLLRDAPARNAALVFGGAIHCGLEAYYRGLSIDDQDIAVVRYFAENPTAPDEYRTPTTALEVLGHYRQRATLPDYVDTTLSDDHGLLIERAFELPLGVLELDVDVPGFGHIDRIFVAWSGRIDRIAEVNGGPHVMDHKTSSIDGDAYVQSFQLSSQTLGYIWAASQLWPHLDIRGFALNCLRLKKPGKGQGLVDRGPRGGEPPLAFFRAFFTYSPERLERWRADTFCMIEDAVHCFVRNEWPMNDRHCFDKFGRCAFWDACTIDDEAVRERFLMSPAFVDVTWNPTHNR